MSYGFHTTTDEVLDGVDLSGKSVLVTGASAGLGEETTRALAAHGASVTMAVRDVARGLAAVDRVKESVPDAQLNVREVDLGSLASIRTFASAFLEANDRLDVLVCNAGVMACPQDTTVDGFELQFGTNHLGHFLLTTSVLPALLACDASRVVVLSSGGHKFSDVSLDDPSFERTSYEPWIAYGRSKTANALVANELDRRYAGDGLHAWSVHPGAIITDLGRHLTEETITSIAEARKGRPQPEWKSVPQGAATSVYGATDASLVDSGGHYLEDCGVADIVTDPAEVNGVMAYAQDPTTAAALWTLSEELTSP
jgi:NAD(P)-dependent dehydrogenase (short-subunit alcohol dehydrogenase family)